MLLLPGLGRASEISLLTEHRLSKRTRRNRYFLVLDIGNDIGNARRRIQNFSEEAAQK
jgi:hypothetical protein